MTRPQAAKVLEVLTAAYRSTSENFTEENARAWMAHLEDVDYEASLQAADQWINEQTRFPTIADFRLAALRTRRLAQSHEGRGQVVCSRCKGEKLLSVDVRAGVEAYIQCPVCITDHHKDGCSCARCHYAKPSLVEYEGLTRA